MDRERNFGIWHNPLPQGAVGISPPRGLLPPLLCSCNSSNCTPNSIPSTELIWAPHHYISRTSCYNKKDSQFQWLSALYVYFSLISNSAVCSWVSGLCCTQSFNDPEEPQRKLSHPSRSPCMWVSRLQKAKEHKRAWKSQVSPPSLHCLELRHMVTPNCSPEPGNASRWAPKEWLLRGVEGQWWISHLHWRVNLV